MAGKSGRRYILPLVLGDGIRKGPLAVCCGRDLATNTRRVRRLSDYGGRHGGRIRKPPQRRSLDCNLDVSCRRRRRSPGAVPSARVAWTSHREENKTNISLPGTTMFRGQSLLAVSGGRWEAGADEMLVETASNPTVERFDKHESPSTWVNPTLYSQSPSRPPARQTRRRSLSVVAITGRPRYT